MSGTLAFSVGGLVVSYLLLRLLLIVCRKLRRGGQEGRSEGGGGRLMSGIRLKQHPEGRELKAHPRHPAARRYQYSDRSNS